MSGEEGRWPASQTQRSTPTAGRVPSGHCSHADCSTFAILPAWNYRGGKPTALGKGSKTSPGPGQQDRLAWHGMQSAPVDFTEPGAHWVQRVWSGDASLPSRGPRSYLKAAPLSVQYH